MCCPDAGKGAGKGKGKAKGDKGKGKADGDGWKGKGEGKGKNDDLPVWVATAVRKLPNLMLKAPSCIFLEQQSSFQRFFQSCGR